jgi:pyruvate/2-oxoglutarate dehydrogenase complex dihydrolipoamide dehydrogenase (E3) component
MLPRIMSSEDPEFSEMVARRFRAEGIDVLVEHKAKEVRIEGAEKGGDRRAPGLREAHRVRRDPLRRRPRRQHPGLRPRGAGHRAHEAEDGGTNEYLQATYPNIYACGDVAGPYQFTHTASHMAWYCAVNGLFGRFKSFRVDYSVIPWATFTDPEVARVGLNETDAKEKGIAYDVFTYGVDDLDRAIADSEAHGLVKVLTKRGTDQIIGCTIAGANAGEIIVEFVTAMKYGVGLNKILGTIHIYPTYAESNKYAAGIWKRSTVTRGQMEVAPPSTTGRGAPAARSRRRQGARDGRQQGTLLRQGTGSRRRLGRTEMTSLIRFMLALLASRRHRRLRPRPLAQGVG